MRPFCPKPQVSDDGLKNTPFKSPEAVTPRRLRYRSYGFACPGPAAIIFDMALSHHSSLRSALKTERDQVLHEHGQLSQDEIRQLPSNVVWVTSDRHLALTVRFVDATLGRVVFEPAALTGALSQLAEPSYFERFTLDNGSVAWPGGQALPSEELYASIRSGGFHVVR